MSSLSSVGRHHADTLKIRPAAVPIGIARDLVVLVDHLVSTSLFHRVDGTNL